MVCVCHRTHWHAVPSHWKRCLKHCLPLRPPPITLLTFAEDGAVNFVKVVKKDDTAGVGAREDWGVQSRFSDDFAKNLKSIKIVIEGDDVQVVKRKDRKKEAEREKPALVHGAFQRSEYVLNEENIFSREALAPVIKVHFYSTSCLPVDDSTWRCLDM